MQVTHSEAFPTLHMAIHIDSLLNLEFRLNLNFQFSLSCLGAVTPERRLIPPRHPASIALRVIRANAKTQAELMLGPAANRQPGFRRRTRRAEQRREEQRC